MTPERHRGRHLKILFLIRSLERGGAERQLCLLAKELADAGHEVHVCTFYRGGSKSGYRDILFGTRVFLHDLGKSGRWDVFRLLFRSWALVYDIQPEVVHGYLPTGNILAAFCKISRPRIKLVFGVRSAVMHLQFYDWVGRFSYWLELKIASIANLVIANSLEGGEPYRAHCRKVAVIPNGVDVEKFCPQAEDGIAFREKFQIDSDAFLIGMVARIDPMKDHESFLRAAASFGRSRPSVTFVVVGGGDLRRRRELQRLAEQLGIGASVIWVGEFDDMPRCYNALDLVTLSSKGEGFPNVIAEAMACAVVPVVSNVGAVSELVGDTGEVVRVGDAQAFEKSWSRLHDMARDDLKALGLRARDRIVSRFSTVNLAHESEKVIISLFKKDS